MIATVVLPATQLGAEENGHSSQAAVTPQGPVQTDAGVFLNGLTKQVTEHSQSTLICMGEGSGGMLGMTGGLG